MSGSMRTTLDMAKQVVRAFLKDSNAQDEFFLATVSSTPELHSGLTEDADGLLNGLLFTGASGDTALIDTIYLALNRIRSAHNGNRALLVISDGMDNHSRYSKGELMSAALESDTQIYTISLDNSPPNVKPVQMAEAHRGLVFMDELADRTGGLNFLVRDPGDALSAASKAGRALRNQYVIGFQPPSSEHSGKWHKVHVQVNVHNVSVSSRNGYYSR
jgi:Ca-activated chloride channel homolog